MVAAEAAEWAERVTAGVEKARVDDGADEVAREDEDEEGMGEVEAARADSRANICTCIRHLMSSIGVLYISSDICGASGTISARG